MLFLIYTFSEPKIFFQLVLHHVIIFFLKGNKNALRKYSINQI